MPAQRFVRLAAAASFIAAAAGSPSIAAEPLKAVASFSILGDLVHRVGQEHVEVTTLVGPNGDAHVYEPTPVDAREAAAADLVFVNGLGFEGWLDRLIEASGYDGTIVVSSKGVHARQMAEDHDHHADEDEPEMAEAHHHHGNVDPHAWQSVPNAEIYVENIAAALCEADGAHCADYEANAATYEAELQSIDTFVRDSVAAVPEARRKVITSHDAFGYFAHEYGIQFIAPEGVSTETEASARDVAELIRQVKAEGVTALFVENMSDPRLIEQIARETGAKPGGELFSDALSEPDGPAATYVDMMRHNARLLAGAMQGS